MKNFYVKIFVCCTILFLLMNCSENLVDKTLIGSISGKVVKIGTNTPLANVKITTSPTTTTTFTDQSGQFTLQDVPIGDYSVKAEIKGYLLAIQGANLKSDGQNVSIVFEMKDDNSLNSPPTIPVLTSPIANAVNQPTSILLTWTSSDPDPTDILKYTVIVKNSSNSDVKTIKDLKTNSYQLDSLKFGTSYFWQVKVSDNINPEVYSEVQRFTISSVPQNRFYYVKNLNGNRVIYSSNQDGMNFQFTSSNFNSFRPRKSNNSGVVAFLRTAGGNNQLFTANLDGSNVFQVTSIAPSGFNLTDIDFSWSANGKELLYSNFDKLYRINKDGSGLEKIYQTPDGSLISESDWSKDGSMIALKTNNLDGYNVKIFIIDLQGNIIKNVIQNIQGAAGGLDFSVDGKKLLYTYDISGFQNSEYRQLNTHIFIFDLANNTKTDLSAFTKIPAGSIDIDPRFSPNEAMVIFTNTSNDGRSQKNIFTVQIDDDSSRTLLFDDAEMPDWE